jgi:hypothetical protein
MAFITLIMGEPGTGKSSSIRTLNPEETFIINVLNKPLPFQGSRRKYVQKEGGNYYASADHNTIRRVMKVASERENIKTIIIDDFQYVMATEFMNRAMEKSYDKFSEIAQHAFQIITDAQAIKRDSLNIIFISHTEIDINGNYKCKTIGKMLDQNVTLEGMFTNIFHSIIVDEQYKFLTQHNGKHIARSPMGMFDTKLVDNDLNTILNIMNDYLENEKL